MTTLDITHHDDTRIARFISAAQSGHSWLWYSAIAMSVGALVCVGLQFVDARELNGANVWVKPAKFFFSLAVHLVTVSWALSLITLRSRAVRIAIPAMIAASWIELVYIVVRAIRGEASHFNIGTPLDALLYSLMGLGAVTITLTTFIVGFSIWKNRNDALITEAASVGLMLGAVLGTIAGGYLSSQTGHNVGGDLTDATGTGFFGWSTTGGDLRIAHFVGLHATQLVPLVALTKNRTAVYGAAILITILTVATFAQAYFGQPLFRL
jgi:hypothetical protein